MWAAYTRVSRVGGRTETLISPDLQAARIDHFAQGRGLEVEHLAPELDVSGGKVERPILSQAIEGVEQGRYTGIIVAQLDRLSRMDVADALHTIRRIENAGGQVIAVAENFDAGTPEGRMARNVLLALGEMQLDRYKRQFSDAKRQAVERGIWPIARVPIGYRKRGDRTLEPDPASRGLVIEAFERRAAGEAWSVIGEALGKGSTSVAKIVRNRVYLGEIRMGELVNRAAHEPLVDRDLFEEAQLPFPRPARRGNPRSLLVGLAVCAGCGYNLTVSFHYKGGRLYRCPAKVTRGGRRCPRPALISARKLEPYVERLALDEIAGLTITASERTLAIDGATDAVGRAEAELDAYQRAVSVSDLGAGAFNAGMRSRAAAVEAARRALAEARMAAGPGESPGTLAGLWPDLTVEERAHVLRGALSAVIVTKGKGPCDGRVRLVANDPPPGGATLA